MASAPATSQAEPEQPALPQLTHRQILTVFIGLMLGMLVAALSQTIVATALPTIVGDLGGQEQLAWVISATLLSSTASMPVWGKLSDLYGRKTMFQSAIAVFVLASLVAGFAQNMPQLIAVRAVQGLGVGGLLALTHAIIGDIVSPRERGKYQGYIASTFALATVSGPLIGGFLVEQLSWRWTLWIGVPIGVVAFVVVAWVMRFPFPKRKRAVDWLGAVLIVTSVSALLLLVSLGGQMFAWHSQWTYILAAITVLGLAATVWQERRADEPIMPPHLFSNHTFVLTSIAGFIVGVAMFGAIIFLPQYLQIVQGQSPTASGLLVLPLMLGLVTSSTVSGRLITRTGRYKLFPVTGLALATVGTAALSRLHVDTSLWTAGVYMLITGVGLGMVMQVLVLAAQNAVPYRDLGVATSGATFFRSMGGAVGTAVFGALLANRLSSTIPEAMDASGVPPEQIDSVSGDATSSTPAEIAALPEPVHGAVVLGFADALQTTFLAAMPFALLGFCIVLFLRELPLETRAGTARAVDDGSGGVATALDTEDAPADDAETAAEPAAVAAKRRT